MGPRGRYESLHIHALTYLLQEPLDRLHPVDERCPRVLLSAPEVEPEVIVEVHVERSRGLAQQDRAR